MGVFEDAGIPYHLGGELTLREACAKARAPLDRVLAEVHGEIARPREVVVDWTTAPLTDLLSHIVDGHHAFSRQLCDQIRLGFRIAQRAHSEWRFLVRLETSFDAFATELVRHFQDEETVAFRYVDALSRKVVPHTPFPSVHGPTGILEFEHESVDETMAQLRKLSDGYVTPPGACSALRSSIAGMMVLERDLHEHLHLENNVLFPRARSLEGELWQPRT